jgi:chromosome partitioning protein
MVFTVACCFLKGGVGKSTTAVAIAESGAAAGRVTLVDCDEQGSCYDWSMLAAASGRPLRSTVIRMPKVRDLTQRLHSVSLGADLLVVDSPPPGDMAMIHGVIAAADYVVAPVPPQRADLARIPSTLEIARQYGKPMRAVLTMVRGGLAERDDAVAALAELGVPVFDAELPLTARVERNYGQPPIGILARFGYEILAQIIKEVQQNA